MAVPELVLDSPSLMTVDGAEWSRGDVEIDGSGPHAGAGEEAHEEPHQDREAVAESGSLSHESPPFESVDKDTTFAGDGETSICEGMGRFCRKNSPTATRRTDAFPR